jgi:hypothetical protein
MLLQGCWTVHAPEQVAWRERHTEVDQPCRPAWVQLLEHAADGSQLVLAIFPGAQIRTAQNKGGEQGAKAYVADSN